MYFQNYAITQALRIEKGSVDVRFFGQHDRAWIPLSGCYLISKDLPLPIKNKKKSKAVGLRGNQGCGFIISI